MSKWKEQKAAEIKPVEQEKPDIPTLEEFEADMENGMEQLHQAFRDRAAKEQQRIMDVCDANYYFVVCFSNKRQLEEFCEKLKLNPDEIYIEGKEFARKVNRALQTPDTTFPKTQPFNKDYAERARK